MTWTARVLLHVDDVAFVQLPGGMLTVNDAQRLLQDGDNVEIDALAVDHTTRNASPYLMGPFRVRNNGQAALLIHGGGMVPLLLRRDERLPEQVFLLVQTEAAEQSEGDEPQRPAPTPATPPVQDLDDPSGCDCSRTFVSPLEVYLRYHAQCAQDSP